MRSWPVISSRTSSSKAPPYEAERKKFLQVVELFREYGERYDMDWLLMAAQGYQSPPSTIMPVAMWAPSASCRSCPPPARAEGRRHPPARAQFHGGVKYMRWMIDHYYADEPMTALDKALFSFASTMPAPPG